MRAALTRDLAPYQKLFQTRGAGFYFSSQLASLVGAAVFELGAIWFTLRSTDSPVLTALVAAAAFIPALISPLAGLASDMASPKRVMIAVDVTRSVMALALGAFVFISGFPPAAVLVVISLLMGLLARVSLPARFAWLGASVPDESLTHANALGTIISNLRLPLGGLVAALFLALNDPAFIFLSCGLLYLISWILLLGLPRPALPEPARNSGRRDRTLGQASSVLSDRRLSASLVFVAASNILLVGAWIVGSPLIAGQIAPDSGLYAVMQAAYGIGVIVGSALVASLSTRAVAMQRVLAGGYIVRALALAGLLLASSRFGVTLAALILGLATPALTVTFPTVLQRLSRIIGNAGTIFGLYGVANAGAISVSIMVYGLVASVVALPGFFVLPMLASLLAALLVARLGMLSFLGELGRAESSSQGPGS